MHAFMLGGQFSDWLLYVWVCVCVYLIVFIQVSLLINVVTLSSRCIWVFVYVESVDKYLANDAHLNIYGWGDK